MSIEDTSSEAFTPAEAAYFKSGGADTSGLDLDSSEKGSTAGDNDNVGNSVTETKEPASDEAEGDGEDDGEEVVVVGKDGKPRVNGRFVPHAAMHKERERRKATEAELQATRERFSRADERLAVLNDILGQAEAPAKPSTAQADETPIDPQTDPLGALNQALKKISSLERTLTEGSKRQGEVESERALKSAYQNDAIRYVQEKPEFKDAYKFVIEGRHRELAAMGMSDANQRNAFIANEERGLVAQALQSQLSPSQMLHNLAIARGFKPAAAPPQQDAAQKIEQIAKGQRVAGVSLSGNGGSSGEGLTASGLADMSEEEFSSWRAKASKADVKRLLGG